MRRHAFILLLLVTLSNACVGQEIWRYPPVDLDPNSVTARLLLEAGRNVENVHVDEAIATYIMLADQNRGSSIGLECLWNAMVASSFFGDKTGYESLRQRLIQEYPDSGYRVEADILGVEEQFFRANSNQKILAYSDLLQQLGAARLDDVLAGRDLEGGLEKMVSLHPEIRRSLMSTYYDVCYMMRNEKHWDEAIRLATFCRAAFDTHPESDNMFTTTLRSMMRARSGNEQIGTLPSEPKVTILSPASGSVVGTRPTISIRLSSGDYRHGGLRLDSLELKVDGVNKTLSSVVQSEVDTTLTQGREFEVLTVTYTPTLAVGSHTVEVKADGMRTRNDPASGPAQVSRTWAFTVANTPPPPNPDPTTQTLQASKDALVYEKNPHSNEGANPKLTLEKITGKASRNLLGFNLSGINAATVSKATLVLTIDPSDQATGWGNGETVNVKPVTVAWQEGNGKSYGLSGSQHTAGSGAGTTWFSPTDDNISNNSSNSVTQWSGGATYATTGAAPPLIVQNHQTGELRFNVTADVRAGAVQGWLLRKDAENKGSKVTFYSKEGAAAAGNPALAPRLILEFGSTTTQAPAKSWLAVVRDLMEQGYRQLQAYRTPPALSWLGRALN